MIGGWGRGVLGIAHLCAVCTFGFLHTLYFCTSLGVACLIPAIDHIHSLLRQLRALQEAPFRLKLHLPFCLLLLVDVEVC